MNIVTQTEIRRVMSALGQRGGKVKSPAKAEASRANGRRGGRPKKSIKVEPVV